MKNLQELAKTCVHKAKPVIIDHQKSNNPYQSKYGDLWEEQIEKSVTLSAFVCITEVIKQMVSASAEVMKGTKHESDWLFYHDALLLLVARSTVNWMKQMGHYERWIKPPPGMQAGNLETYNERPVGDLPKFMPWDTSLNNDLHLAVKRHIALTTHFETANPRKFDMSTPLRGNSAYLQLLDPITGNVPLSRRIVQDCFNILNHLRIVYEHHATVVQGIGNQSGKRQPVAVSAVADVVHVVDVAVVERLAAWQHKQKEARAKEIEISKKWMHPDAWESMHKILKNSTVKYEAIRAPKDD